MRPGSDTLVAIVFRMLCGGEDSLQKQDDDGEENQYRARREPGTYSNGKHLEGLRKNGLFHARVTRQWATGRDDSSAEPAAGVVCFLRGSTQQATSGNTKYPPRTEPPDLISIPDARTRARRSVVRIRAVSLVAGGRALARLSVLP